MFGGLELEPAVEHDDGPGFSVVTGPSAEAGADPCAVGERGLGVGVFLALGPAFELGAEGLQQGLVFGLEGIGDGPQRAWSGVALAGVNELLEAHRGDEGGHDQPAQGALRLR